MAHKRTLQSGPDEPEQSPGDKQEKETVHTDEHKRAIEEAFRSNEARLQEALQLAEANYAQLERTKSQLRAIIDASQEAMLFLSPGGRPLRVNTRFTDFFGLDDTTVLSQSADELTALLKGLFVDAVLLDRSPTGERHGPGARLSRTAGASGADAARVRFLFSAGHECRSDLYWSALCVA